MYLVTALGKSQKELLASKEITWKPLLERRPFFAKGNILRKVVYEKEFNYEVFQLLSRDRCAIPTHYEEQPVLQTRKKCRNGILCCKIQRL